MIGTMKWFNAQKGYGFIQPENGDKDTFYQISMITTDTAQILEAGA